MGDRKWRRDEDLLKGERPSSLSTRNSMSPPLSQRYRPDIDGLRAIIDQTPPAFPPLSDHRPNAGRPLLTKHHDQWKSLL